MSPYVTDQEWPMAGTATETIAEEPIPIRSGPTTAMGTPNPATPCKNELNTQPRISSCKARLSVSFLMPAPMVSMAPVSCTTLYKTNAIHTI